MADIFLKNDQLLTSSQKDNSISFRKQFISGTVDLAHDCNETGYYWIDAIVKAPVPHGFSTSASSRFMVHTIAYNYQAYHFRYQTLLCDWGKYYRGSWNGDDSYGEWQTD